MSAFSAMSGNSSSACAITAVPAPKALLGAPLFKQSRLEAPRLSGFSYSILDLNAAMRNQAARERAMADAAVLQERNAAEAAAFEATKLELLKAAEKEAEDALQQVVDTESAAFREAEEAAQAAQRQVEEAVRQAEESWREVEEAKRRVEEEVEKSRQAAARAMEHPEEVELAALPDRIAEARFYECVDAEKIAEAERIYKKRAVAAFHLENAQERLLRAVAQGRADNGGTSLLNPAAGTVVRRVLAVPLPTLTVTTTHTLPLPLKEGEGKALSEEDDKSTAASDEISEA